MFIRLKRYILILRNVQTIGLLKAFYPLLPGRPEHRFTTVKSS